MTKILKTGSRVLNKILFVLTALCLVLLVFAVFSDHPSVYAFFFNSDLLYLPTLYEGLFVEGYPLESWYLNPSILLIPDVAIYFLLHFITQDAIISLFSFGVIQHLLILAFMVYVLRNFYREDNWYLASLGALMMFLFLLGSIVDRAFLFASFSLASTIHTGVFVMALLCIALTLDYFNTGKSSRIIWLFVFATLSVLSDRLFILLYIIPVGLLALFLTILYRKRVPLVLFINAGLSVTLGLWLNNYLDGEYFHLLKLPSVTEYSNIIPSFRLMMQQIGGEMSKQGVFMYTMILSGISFLVQLYLAIRILVRRDFYSAISFYILYSVIFIAGIFLMPVLTGTYTNIDVLRYNMGAFYLALLNIGFLAGYFIHHGKKSGIRRVAVKSLLVAVVALMSYTGYKNLSTDGLKQFFNYYPQYVQEVDEIARKENLFYGVADFWYAKPITVFSRENLKVYHTFDQMVPYYHSTCTQWYLDDDHIFNYAVLSSFDDKSAYREYLDHEGRIVTQGHTEVLVLPPFRYEVERWAMPGFIEQDSILQVKSPPVEKIE